MKEGFLNRDNIKGFLFFFVDIIIIIFVVLLIKNFIFTPFKVDGHSMKDTLHHNDYILVEKFSYTFSEPKFGDIVVIEPTDPRLKKAGIFECFVTYMGNIKYFKERSFCEFPDLYIKRIMGIPGDLIEIKEGFVYRNGNKLDEKYLNEENFGKTMTNPMHISRKEYLVPEGKVLVFGDNRNHSSDSRAWNDPFVPYENINGKFFIEVFSLNFIFGDKK